MIHGVIQINHYTICEYEITNMMVNTPDGVNMYTFWAEGTEKNGNPYEFKWIEFVKPTTAPNLVATLLKEVHKRLVGE